MNSGKSTALCALAPGAAIVDETPGTTADVKVALAEGHGENLGPLKLMDSCVFLEFGFFRRKPKNSLFFLKGAAAPDGVGFRLYFCFTDHDVASVSYCSRSYIDVPTFSCSSVPREEETR